MLTACKDCRHLLSDETTSRAGLQQYNLCAASLRTPEFDAYNGQFIAPRPLFKLCREVNTGACPLFERREP